MSQLAIENKMQLGQLLLARQVVTETQIQEALQKQKQQGHSRLLGEVLVELGYCTYNQIAEALAETYEVPYASVNPKICDPRILEILPKEFLDKHTVLPLFKVYNVLTVAVSEPTDVFLRDEIEQITGCQVQIVCATRKDIEATLQTHLPAANVFVSSLMINYYGCDTGSTVNSMKSSARLIRCMPPSYQE